MRSQCFSVGTQISGALGDENSLTSEHRTDLGVLQNAGISRGNYSTAAISNDNESVFSANDEVQGSFNQNLSRRNIPQASNQVGPSYIRQNSVQMSIVDRQRSVSDAHLEPQNQRIWEKKAALKQQIQNLIEQRAKGAQEGYFFKPEESVEAKIGIKILGDDSRDGFATQNQPIRNDQQASAGSPVNQDQTSQKRKSNSQQSWDDQNSNRTQNISSKRQRQQASIPQRPAQALKVEGVNQIYHQHQSVNNNDNHNNFDIDEKGEHQNRQETSHIIPQQIQKQNLSNQDVSLSVRGQIQDQQEVQSIKTDSHNSISRSQSLNFGPHVSRHHSVGVGQNDSVIEGHGTKVLFGRSNLDEQPSILALRLRDHQPSHSFQYQGQNYGASIGFNQPAQSMANNSQLIESSPTQNKSFSLQPVKNAYSGNNLMWDVQRSLAGPLQAQENSAGRWGEHQQGLKQYEVESSKPAQEEESKAQKDLHDYVSTKEHLGSPDVSLNKAGADRQAYQQLENKKQEVESSKLAWEFESQAQQIDQVGQDDVSTQARQKPASLDQNRVVKRQLVGSPSESSKVVDKKIKLDHKAEENDGQIVQGTPFDMQTPGEGKKIKLRMQESQKAMDIRESSTGIGSIWDEQQYPLIQERMNSNAYIIKQMPQGTQGQDPNTMQDLNQQNGQSLNQGRNFEPVKQRFVRSGGNSCASGKLESQDNKPENNPNQDFVKYQNEANQAEEGNLEQSKVVLGQIDRNDSTYGVLNGPTLLRRTPREPSEDKDNDIQVKLNIRFRSSVDENPELQQQASAPFQQEQPQDQGDFREMAENSTTSILGEINFNNNTPINQQEGVNSQQEQNVTTVINNYIAQYKAVVQMYEMLQRGANLPEYDTNNQNNIGQTQVERGLETEISNVVNYLVARNIEPWEILNFIEQTQGQTGNQEEQIGAILRNETILEQGLQLFSRLFNPVQASPNQNNLEQQNVLSNEQQQDQALNQEQQQPQQASIHQGNQERGMNPIPQSSMSVNNHSNEQSNRPVLEVGNYTWEAAYQDQGSIVVRDEDQQHYMAGPSNYVQRAQDSQTQNSNLPEEDLYQSPVKGRTDSNTTQV